MQISKKKYIFAVRMMTYEDTLTYLYASQPAFHVVGAAAYKPGLQNTERLLAHLGHPENQWPAVHIAGTNGKGSTSHLIAASLQCAGLKVGLYTSPHLVDFRERIRVNGQMIAEQEVVRFVAENKSVLEAIQPSFFETTMAMAFDYFAREQVDIAVIEVGLGGRLDSTNILPPYSATPCPHGVRASVITNIGLDHTEFLGTTLAQIAAEKAGIIKPGVPCVIGETDHDTASVFMHRAQECGLLGKGLETTNCRIWFADQCGYLRRCRERDIRACELTGAYQSKNMQTAYVVLRALEVPTAAIREGFRQVCTLTGLRGRWETVAQCPRILCDTGHNSHGIRYVAEQLEKERQQLQEGGRLRIVFGMVSDKDVQVVLRLLPHEAMYYFTQAQTHRAIAAEHLLEMAQEAGLQGRTFGTVEQALHTARTEAGQNDLIFIGGSNYVVGEALRLL